MPTKSGLDKPTSVEEYEEWLRDNYDIDLGGGGEERRYQALTLRLKDQFTESSFWSSLGSSLDEWHARYREEHEDYPLLETRHLPNVDTKRFSSLVEKTYRLNILLNDEWPGPPRITDSRKEWYGPANWYELIHDVIRARFTVKYMDGAQFLVERIARLAAENGRTTRVEYLARPDGYHAVHILVSQDFNTIDRETSDPVTLRSLVEIQVTTEIQATILDMLHNVYERWRLEGAPEGWQWQHDSAEFAVNYLGHTLHYLEGMIVVARERSI